MAFERQSFVENLDLSQNLLILGPEGTGKSSLLKALPIYQNALFVDLDDPLLVRELLNKPEFLTQILNEVQPNEWLTVHRIDRISKHWPQILAALTQKKIFLAGTLSSLKSFPETQLQLFNLIETNSLTYSQMANTSSTLNEILSYGCLPKVYNSEKTTDKIRYLKNYIQDFLDLEILAHSFVRNLVPFHLFLPRAAELSGQKINLTSLAHEINVDYKSIQNYYDLLIQFKMGFLLPAYDKVVRKAQSQAAKFYFFDCGVHRAFANTLDNSLKENSLEYQQLFKSWCIQEVAKINYEKKLGLKLSQLETKDTAILDLIIERSDGTTTAIVFSTAPKILPKHLKALKSLGRSMKCSHIFCVNSVSKTAPTQDEIIIHYKDFFESLK